MAWVRFGTILTPPVAPSSIPRYFAISNKTLLSGEWLQDVSQMFGPSFNWDGCQVFVIQLGQGWVDRALTR